MKYLSKILVFGIVFTLYATSASADEAYENATGPYDIAAPTEICGPIPASECGEQNSYWIFQPANIGVIKHPLVVYCVGANGNPSYSADLLNSLASHGVIVIAGTLENQSNQWAQQAIDGINWLIAQDDIAGSPYEGKLNTDNVMAIGMSEGGNAALMAATRNDKIKSVIALAPGVVEDFDQEVNRYRADAALLEVPVLYIAGGFWYDVVVPPLNVYNYYYVETQSDAWFASKKWVGHFGITTNAAIAYYIRAWVYTHLYPTINGVAPQEFYGDPWGLEDDTRFSYQQRNHDNAQPPLPPSE